MSSPVWSACPAYITTGECYYVRTDGGTDTQCNGKTDHALAGATGTNCAVSHPYYIQPLWNTTSRAITFNGGDNIIIGPGTYPMGYYGLSEYSTQCNSTYTADCEWRLPGGPDANHPTRVLGSGYRDGSSAMPELYATGALAHGVIYLTFGNSNFELQYLNITDHQACSNGATHTSIPCSGGNPGFGRYGITSGPSSTTVAGTGSDNVLIKNVTIHGMAMGCMEFSASKSWTFTNVVCRGNGYEGLEGDNVLANDTADGQSGTKIINHMIVEYSGCVEDYPTTTTIRTASCVSQTGGWGGTTNYYQGYGDAFGLYGTMSNWDINDLTCIGSTQDCFDGLHGNGTGYVHIRNSLFVHNAGQAVKMNQPFTFENNVVIEDCGYHVSAGLAYNDGTHGIATWPCRPATSTAISFQLAASTTYSIIGNTFFSNADYIFETNGTSTGSTIVFKNNIVYGARVFNQDSSNPVDSILVSPTDSLSRLWAHDSGFSGTYTADYNVIYNTKDGASDISGQTHSVYSDPGFVGTIKTGPYSGVGYNSTENVIPDYYLSSTSTARYAVRGVNTADESVTSSCVADCSLDYHGVSRGVNWDTGALQYGTTTMATGGWGICSVNGDCYSNVCTSSSTCYPLIFNPDASTQTGSYAYNIKLQGSIKFQ